MRITTRLWLVFGVLTAALVGAGLAALSSAGAADPVELGALAAASAALIALGVVVRRQIDRPLRALLAGGRRLASEGTGYRPDVATPAELGELAAAFNRMATQQQAAKREADRLRHQWELILNSAAEGICSLDRDGILTFVNSAAAEMLGYRREEVMGKPVHTLIRHSGTDGAPHSDEECPIRRTVVEGEPMSVRGEVFWCSDGSPLSVEYASTPIEESGDIVGVVVTFRDVGEQRAVERIKDEFVSVVSHELRTPLTSIRGALGLMASGMLGDVPEKGQRMLDIAVSNADRLVRLINDILDIERMESGKVVPQFETCNAADLMSQAAETMRAMALESGISLSVAPVWAQLHADPDRILQMLTNLLSNAIRFSDWGGKVWLTADRRGDELVVKVGDQGRGIPEDRLDAIFGRFQQVDASDSREKGGTGLGLAICKMIAEQHGGRIWAESTLGRGSVFYCALPIKMGAPGSEQSPEPAPHEEETEPEEDRGKALVIADRDTAEPILQALEDLGLDVLHAHSFLHAMRLASNAVPSLVVVDAKFDDAVASEVLVWMRRQTALEAVPMIAYASAGTPDAQLQRLRDAGADHVVPHSDSVQDLERAFAGLVSTEVRAT